MKDFIEKLIGRLEGESYLTTNDDGETDKFSVQVVEWKDIRKIVNELAEEQKHDMVTQLAMMYAKNIYVYGVDVTKAWESAVQNHMALEKAYIRGRQDEGDKFSEWQEEHKDKDCSQCSRRSWYQKGYADAEKKIAEKQNNNYCEWKKQDGFYLFKTSCGIKDADNDHYKFCPYCGKKIKVVEPKGE